MVEKLFSDITTKKIRRGVFKNAKALETDIMDCLKKHYENP
jgi:hypothetical protein